MQHPSIPDQGDSKGATSGTTPGATGAPLQSASQTSSPSTVAGVPPSVSPLPAAPATAGIRPLEIGGRDGPEPTRFGDWEKAGRCIDF
jgi:hypothetical protein